MAILAGSFRIPKSLLGTTVTQHRISGTKLKFYSPRDDILLEKNNWWVSISCFRIFFSRENEIVDIFQAFIGNKTNCDGPAAPHTSVSVSIFCHFTQQIMFWNLSYVEKLLRIFLWHGKIWTLYTCCKYLPVFVSMLLQNIFQYVFF